MRMGLDNESQVTVGKVRKDGGLVGGREAIPIEVLELLDKRWSETLGDIGLEDYAAMRASLAAK